MKNEELYEVLVKQSDGKKYSLGTYYKKDVKGMKKIAEEVWKTGCEYLAYKIKIKITIKKVK
jgi:ribosomal protein L31E